ncbi:helix-turn-helix transcriptional regulator [Paucibacter sp. DJ1R-11]|uniref:helix-turn-helix transcriptional regulator n=1 Tax=Paucibacter sp. DJ1R-11 TaxID=2893556 RepID=UPI0021E3F08A|nr:AraC family transcriptional regulator [Paucibacter sp. DJ1R-11]MCV2365742.1 helix-turn-helix transcriptional regulator [Paucibacter sp. DJ1R-11]
MNATQPATAPGAASRKTSPRRAEAARAIQFDSHQGIERYIAELNARAPMAHREIASWGRDRAPRLQLELVQAPRPQAESAAPQLFLTESRNSFVLNVRSQTRQTADSDHLLVGLVLSGSVRMQMKAEGECLARAGEGLLFNPTEVAQAQFAADSHFVEIALPREPLLRLSSTLWTAAGSEAPPSLLRPKLAPALAQKLHFMAQQASALLQHGDETSPPILIERWVEMMGLSLLHEQAMAAPGLKSCQGRPEPMMPRNLRRALDYLDAHAQSEILLTDIAAAACVSVSSLLRHFNEHLGLTPMAYLRQLRLDRARAELRQGKAGRIGELAQRWGFQSAGKFSQAYLRRFGERPSDSR